MASRFCGFFDVACTWLDGQCVSDAFSVDDWLLVGCCADSKISTFGYVEVVSVDFSRRDALHMLRKFIHDDSYQRTNWDYEIWHVVETPDWMPSIVRDDVFGAPGERYACACVQREDGRTVTFGSMDDARDYVLTALGDWSDDFDVDGIARDVTRWLDGRLCLLALDFWAVAAEHDLMHA